MRKRLTEAAWTLRVTPESLLLVVLIERPHGQRTTHFGKEGMDSTQECRSSWLKPHRLKLLLWFGNSLASFVWTGAVAFIHKRVAAARHSTKSGSDPTAALLGRFSPCSIWRQSRTPGSLTLVSATTKHKSLHWACNRHLPVTGKAEKTEPGNVFHLRQGLLPGHSGMEGASSRIIFEPSGSKK